MQLPELEDFSADHIKGLPATTRGSRATKASKPREWLYREEESKKHFCAMELQNWKGLISKAMFLRAWATRSDSWGMHAAHSLSVLHKSRKQLLLPSVLGH